MKTEFLTLEQKQKLFDSLVNGSDPRQYSKDIFKELDRLENIIKHHELTLELVNDRFASSTFKKPSW